MLSDRTLNIIKSYTLADKLEIEVFQDKIQAKVRWLDSNKTVHSPLQMVLDGPLEDSVISKLAWDIVRPFRRNSRM